MRHTHGTYLWNTVGSLGIMAIGRAQGGVACVSCETWLTLRGVDLTGGRGRKRLQGILAEYEI